MAHPSWEDLGDFFDPDEFATEAVIRSGPELVAEVLGIFDDPNQIAELGEFDLDTVRARFVCQEASVVNVRQGHIVTIEGREFEITEEPRLDGTGIATLLLNDPVVPYDAGI